MHYEIETKTIIAWCSGEAKQEINTEFCWGNFLGSYITPWSRVLLEKLTVTQLVKKFPAFFFGTLRFITVIKRARNWSTYILFISPHPVSSKRISTNQPSKRVCIQKFPDWPPGARTANGTALRY
jgi:hypothetical protein